MEMPAKMQYEPSLYVRLHRTLYPTFGKTAGPAEAVAVASTAALAWLERRQRRRSSRLTIAAAGCLAAAHGIFWSIVQPANVEMMQWPLDAIPQDWAKWRNRWEYGHAVRAGLVTTATSEVVARHLFTKYIKMSAPTVNRVLRLPICSAPDEAVQCL
jgi:hypothetical protein